MFNRKRESAIVVPESKAIEIPKPDRRTRGYDRRATGISVDFVYKPPSFAHEMKAGGYGDAVSYTEVFSMIGQYPSEDFLGACIVGTDAGRYFGKRLVNHFENYGAWNGLCGDVTRLVAIIPLTDAMGCGACPGSSVVVSPGAGFHEGLDTLYHEYLHNIGWDHQYDENGNQINRGNDPIYIHAARMAGHLGQFPEA